jgi:small-conductance mechanosensitive channel/CRP-like cAMP-binding protein
VSLSALFAELRDERTLWLFVGFAVVVALARLVHPEERKRLKSSLVLVSLHLILVLVAGGMRGTEAESYKGVRLASLVFYVLAAIGMVGMVLFSVILPRLRLNAPRILRDVVSAAAGVIAIASLAKRAGFPLSGLITTSAVLTAVIGFSLQDTLGNIMGGLAVQMDNSIRVGDWIKVGDLTGKVSEIRWRYTAIETRNWETVVIPNSLLMKGQVMILGRRRGKPFQWRRWIYFHVDFRYPPSDVIHAVTEALHTQPIDNVAADPPPNCIFIDVGDSFAKYAIRYWLTDLAVDDPTDSEVRTRLYFALKRADIAMSIPAQAVFVTEESKQRKEKKGEEERKRRLRALDTVDLLHDLGDEDRGRLVERLRHSPFTRGEIMTRQGAEAHWLYMIISGEASVRVSVEGAEREVARLHAGDVFGEMGLLTGEPRSATVVALADCECYRLDKTAFQDILRDRPTLAESAAEILARRRVELTAVKEGLDAEAKARRLAATKSDLLGKIRLFFGMDGGG